MKEYSVYGNIEGGVPLILINTYEGDGSSEWEALKKMSLPPFTLVVVHGMDWDADMSPFPADPVFKGQKLLGHGPEYLSYLLKEVVPNVQKSRQIPFTWMGIAGYSLAGLFACYALFVDSPFSRFASASGSLWYPGFLDFAKNSGASLKGKKVSLSLGDKESLTKHPILSTVGDKTQEFLNLVKEKGAEATFDWNPGNHYAEPEARLARTIAKLF